MFEFQKDLFNKSLVILSSIIIILGIVIRFYYQFIEWSFNGDEVNLGLDILNHNYKDLFDPFQSRQSAPPLFLLIEKLSSEIAKPFISLKIISFLASCASIFLFNKIIKNSFSTSIQLILLALFCFNPFVFSTSLTLKQYSLDLLMGLIAVNYFFSNKEYFRTFIFFCVFCLISNVGLFFSASFVIFHLIKIIWVKREKLFNWKFAKRISSFLLAPIPYLLFFIWFLNQAGASNMKNYMVNYWSGSFMPLDLSIFKWLAIQGKVIFLFFFSTYWVLGLPMLLLFLFGTYVAFQKRHQIHQKKFYGIILLYIITAIIHLFLSALKMYPFSDRLFLYLAPGIYLIIGVGLEYINQKTWIGWKHKLIHFSILIIPISTIVLYGTYLPKKANDVSGLIEFINSTDERIVFTPKAKQNTLRWLEFTKYFDQDYSKNNRIKEINGGVDNGDVSIVIGVQSEKFGHTIKYTTPEPEITRLIELDKIFLYYRIGGYAIYRYK